MSSAQPQPIDGVPVAAMVRYEVHGPMGVCDLMLTCRHQRARLSNGEYLAGMAIRTCRHCHIKYMITVRDASEALVERLS